jgi:hypothetical protein
VPGASPELINTLARALDPDSARRTPTARQLRDELRATGDGEDFTTVPWHEPAPPEKSKKGWLIVLSAAATAVVVLGVAGTWLAWPKDTPSLPAAADSSTSAEPSTEPSTPAPTTSKPGVPPSLTTCTGSETNGFCPSKPMCFQAFKGGFKEGETGKPQRTAKATASCAEKHPWEVFGGGWLPDGGYQLSVDALWKLPEVKAACASAVMRYRTKAGADTAAWKPSMVPLEMGKGGKPYFYCVGGPKTSAETIDTVFTTG